ncbi:hypothetical protein FRB96_005430 [Tulasnella sp. 330]|nr:hypothetical protein FRB96_005430 [Tulasnella sp. 330]KAG8871053.1 hypothetical protein FRB97_009106 [Tulasnella sp. 331]
MFSKTLIATGLYLAACIPFTVALTVTGPNSSDYWVFGVTNTITWTYSANDPTPVTVYITNANSSTLNGAFSIAENVPTSQQSIEVTNVTLKPGSGYVVNFVNPTNNTDVYATSDAFNVEPQGTLPFGDKVFTTTSFSVSGSVTLAFTLTETSSATPTGISSGLVNATDAAGTAATATTSTTAGPATATIIRKPSSSSGADSLRFAEKKNLLASLGMGVLGALVGSTML